MTQATNKPAVVTRKATKTTSVPSKVDLQASGLALPKPTTKAVPAKRTAKPVTALPTVPSYDDSKLISRIESLELAITERDAVISKLAVTLETSLDTFARIIANLAQNGTASEKSEVKTTKKASPKKEKSEPVERPAGISGQSAFADVLAYAVDDAFENMDKGIAPMDGTNGNGIVPLIDSDFRVYLTRSVHRTLKLSAKNAGMTTREMAQALADAITEQAN